MLGSVSIIIPCFNHNNEILKALDSVNDLTQLPSEVIVVDDGSKVPVTINSSSFRFPLRIIRTVNQGLAAARNTGLNQAKAQWVLFLDSDDILHDNALDIVNSLAESALIDVIASPYRMCNDTQEVTVYPAVGEPSAGLLQGNIGPCHSFIFRRKTLTTIGGYSEETELRKGHEDYELITRLVLSNALFISQYTPTCDYVQTPNSMSTHKNNMMESKLFVWLRFFLALDISSSHQLLMAASFYAKNFENFQCLFSDSIDLITDKLSRCSLIIEPHPKELEFCLSGLPIDIQKKIQPKLSNSSGELSVPIALQVYDWRAQSILDAIIVRRLLACIDYMHQTKHRKIALWGANEQAFLAAKLLGEEFQPFVIDSNAVTRDFCGLTIFKPNDVDFSGDWPILITAQNAYNAISKTIKMKKVNASRIF
jgi:glycosyltransferase involved in cell wall biosynthesis